MTKASYDAAWRAEKGIIA
jgi:hypothetical protein